MQVFEYKGFQFLDGFFKREYLEQHRANEIKSRASDVYVTSYPKSGTSWVIHALLTMYDDWGLLEVGDRKITPMPDYLYRVPQAPGILGNATRKFVAAPNEIASPRLFKTHLPPSLFPSDWKEKGSRVIYIARNPKDVCVSSYHFRKAIFYCWGDIPTWDEYVQMFVDGKDPGPWLKHVTEWHKLGADDRVFHVTYEDLKRDMKTVFKNMAEFLGRPLPEEQLDKVVASCSLEEMRKHAVKELDLDDKSFDFGSCKFFRKGQTGNWKDYFTVAQSEMFDNKFGNGLNEAGLEFIYEV